MRVEPHSNTVGNSCTRMMFIMSSMLKDHAESVPILTVTAARRVGSHRLACEEVVDAIIVRHSFFRYGRH